MYIIIIHNDIKWPILYHNSQTQITSLTFANYHHIMCSAKLVRRYFDMITVFVCVSFFFLARKLARVNLFTFLWQIDKNWGDYLEIYEGGRKREREKEEKEHRGESFKWRSFGQCTGSSNTRSVCLVPSLFGCPWSRYWQRHGDTTKEPHCTPVQAMGAW